MKRILLLLALLLAPCSAYAGAGTITVLDSAGATKTFVVVTDGTGNFVSSGVICDYLAAANCATVNASHQLGVVEANSASILTAVQAAIPAQAGTVIIGGVGFDQTTPGTTNATSLKYINATAVVSGGLAGTLGVGGATATNVAITDNPLNFGGQAVSSENAVVTTGRKVQFVADLTGKQIILPYANPENILNPVPTAAITDTTSTQVMAAIASFRNYVNYCKVTNAHATVGTYVQILDGSTVVDSGYAAAAGGGWVTKYDPPIRGTTNTALNCQATTTNSNFKCSCGGFKGV